MKKAVLSTIIVIQLVLLLLLTFATVEEKKSSFIVLDRYHRVGAYRIASSFVDIKHDYEYLKLMNATDETVNEYLSFVNSTFEKEYLMKINITNGYLVIDDPALAMRKEGKI
jgi:23S rRNA A2030 N6-methylase RlmJ